MSSSASRPARLFTVDEANARLPLVRAITADLVQLARELSERRQRLAALTEGRDLRRGNPYEDELAQMEVDLVRDTERLRHYVSELRELGVEPKGAVEGLVDFPALRDGRVVYLCWKLGEPEVAFWHELEAGYAGRQPLVAETVGGGRPAPAGEESLRPLPL